MQEKNMLLTVSQVAEELHCGKGYVYKLIKYNLLPALKVGRLKVRRASLEEFLAKYEGFDLTDPSQIKELALDNISEVADKLQKEVS